jgi:hypothetical protein
MVREPVLAIMFGQTAVSSPILKLVLAMPEVSWDTVKSARMLTKHMVVTKTCHV